MQPRVFAPTKMAAMRTTLFWKLFGLQLAVAAALVGSALLVMRAQTALSFSAYVEASERQRLHEAAAQFARSYLDQGRDLAAAVDAMHAYLGDGPPRPRFGPPPGPEGWRPPHPPRPPPPPPGLPPRSETLLQLQDAQGRFVAGNPRLPHDNWREEVRVDGQLIGYVARPPVRNGGHPDEAGFRRAQLRALLTTGAFALVLAALAAAAIAALLLRPVRLLAEGTARLARREFGARLPVLGADELGRLAEDFNRLAEALERYDARQRQWLADIAHELRTPLAVLRGELEAMQDGVRAMDAQGLRSLQQELLRLQALVDDLHLLSLADAGGLRLQQQALAPRDLIAETLERYRGRLEAAGYALRAEVADGLPPIRADAQRLQQVLGNLLENLLRHATPGPVQLRVARLGSEVEFALADSGPGVPEAALPRLFDRLYRVEAARTRAGGGAGLGLAICRSIVEAHGGRIGARAARGGGLEVWFTLPPTAGTP